MFHFFCSVAEIPTLLPHMLAWKELQALEAKHEGVDDEADSPAARLLWAERLLFMQRRNSKRLIQLAAGHGFFIHMDDYTLPGKKL